ncbi:hypothetical protein IEQ34_011752 [Dendrobium chrysotoxum]|uniref:Uncharacterized protein n=1 Tax=Dendrobium chrysotoxum TaxID=161865 RepID=A0AAV7GTC3_DENCH|nr:hypothetical protein IEQ34_011752 [Dendrobium chrysotoxum]
MEGGGRRLGGRGRLGPAVRRRREEGRRLVEKKGEEFGGGGGPRTRTLPALAAVNQNPSCYLSENASTSRPDGLLPNGGSSSAIISGGPAGNQNVQLGNVSSNFSGRLEVPASMLSSKNSLMGRNHMMNGTTIKTEPSYTTNSEFAFTGSSFLETQPTIDTLGASFSGTELTAQALNEPLQDIDSSPYGFLSHIPRNFSFSDLTDGFAQSAVILESYDRSPFLAPEANNFTGSPGVDCNALEHVDLQYVLAECQPHDWSNQLPVQLG